METFSELSVKKKKNTLCFQGTNNSMNKERKEGWEKRRGGRGASSSY